jgi:uncharacterized protein (TIGR04255 family)
MDVPAAPHERFVNPPLKALIGQIRFPPILQITDPAFIAPFQEQLRGEYPQLTAETRIPIVAGPDGAIQMKPTNLLRLANNDKSWSVVVAPTHVSLESGVGYSDFGEFLSRVQRLWEAALTHIRPTRRDQQGLRYINHIEGNHSPSEWRSIVNPALLGPIGDRVLGENVEQWVSDYRIAQPDGSLVLKHGFLRAGPSKTPGYLLDFDYFTRLNPDRLDTEVVVSTFRAFHDVIYPLFRWCVTEGGTQPFRLSTGADQ